jgi:hypothetical protein
MHCMERLPVSGRPIDLFVTEYYASKVVSIAFHPGVEV